MKTILIVLLFASLVSVAAAEEKLYRYNDNMPMAEMMLDMMDGFGMVDKVHPGEGYGHFVGLGALGLLSGNYLGNIEQLKKLQQLQTLQNLGALSPLNQPVIPPSTQDLFATPSAQKPSAYDAVPGFFGKNDDQFQTLVDAAKHAQQHGTGEAIQGAVDTSALDGIWRNSNREILMISKGRFIWEDSRRRKLAGYMKVVGTLLVATIPGHEKPLEFFYAISGNYLNVYDSTTGRTFSFFRSRR